MRGILIALGAGLALWLFVFLPWVKLLPILIFTVLLLGFRLAVGAAILRLRK